MKNINKRKIKKKWCIIFSLLLLVAVWIIFTNTHIQKTKIAILSSDIPDDFNGYKIAVVADLHNKDWGYDLIKLLKKEEPDIIAVVGDLIDSSHMNLNIAMEFIREAKKISPIYFVSGNHEAWSGKYETLKKSLVDEDVFVLDDDKLLLNKGNDNLLLLGVKDPDFNETEALLNESMENKLKELIDNYQGYKILLSHRPELMDSYTNAGVDLVLTGHAHGGQFRIPFIGGLIAPNQGFFPKYTSGKYSKEKTDMVVSRGLGNSIVPVRINNSPELVIVLLEIKR